MQLPSAQSEEDHNGNPAAIYNSLINIFGLCQVRKLHVRLERSLLAFHVFFSLGKATRRLVAPVNFRQKEKEILDQIIGADRYDSRIRPAGMINDTSKFQLELVTSVSDEASRSDAPVNIKINLYVRSISRIDDVKMVRKMKIKL